MNRKSGARTTRLALASAVMAAAVVTSACSTGGGEAKDQRAGAGATGAADSNRSRAANAQVAPTVPELTAKIEDITTDEFMKVVDNVSWTGHTEERQCDENGCKDTPGTKSTRVRHEAAAGANDLVFARIPANGVVVSRMRNLGKRKEKVYQLESGKGDYYVILTPTGTPDKANLQLVNLDFDRDGKPVLELLPKVWTAGRCESGHHASASAGFKDCPPPKGTAPTAPTAFPAFNKGAWFTCSLGCCSTEGVRLGPGRRKGADSTRTDSTARDSTRSQQRPR
jgi:hypothetical protein